MITLGVCAEPRQLDTSEFIGCRFDGPPIAARLYLTNSAKRKTRKPPRSATNGALGPLQSNSTSMVICERHWSKDPPLVKLPGGSTRPAIPPSIFNVPLSSLPTKKFALRPAKTEEKQLRYFLQNGTITSFDSFKPDRELQKKYKNLIISRLEIKLLCQNFSVCILSIVVDNNPTLCCPLSCNAFRKVINVQLSKILNPNNGLRSYSQFNDVVHFAINYDIPSAEMIDNAVNLLHDLLLSCEDTEKEKKLYFSTRQLKLLSQKNILYE